MTRCARCRRKVTAPVFAGGMAFGSVCFRKVAGSKPRRQAKVEDAGRADDPRQADLFPEVTS